MYNTPRLTDDGFRYWNTYGFHRPDHPAQMWHEEVKGWKTAIDIKPKKPLKTMAMVTEYYEEEDLYSDEITTLHGHTNMANTSEEIHGYIYETVRKNGFNAPIGRLGYECFEGMEGKQRKNVSRLMEKAVCDAIAALSNPLVRGENVGVTLFESQKGTLQLLCIDYSKYLNADIDKKIAIVKFDIPIKNISTDRDIAKVRDKNGYIKEIRFDIRPHESVMFTLTV